ncbi:unnamed protein product [Rotaria sp. Silwood1]|nr:unnamed protein product [Rotaria sp. Silwood1]CAF1313017.1 unnamed protein product [Rotaria sp. Silwood1]CAF3521812.1 unnamed protein product [Rotaria sp. Silwood1]CAF3557909.1 unnamed protein product [Rotaria sp. Silwood1]CAF4613481.1 unnamed protein product [Rotaria sp. Silwood1]
MKHKIIVHAAYCTNDNDAELLPITLNDERMRYQYDLIGKDQLKHERVDKQKAIAELNSIIFDTNKLNIFQPMLDNHTIVLFNNHNFLHGRTKIQGMDRYLLRVRFNLKHE